MAESHRPLRVAEDIKASLGRAFVADLADARLQQLVITRVEVPADLSVAWVYVRSMQEAMGDLARDALLRALKRVAPRLRRELAVRIHLRRVPELRFEYDRGIDASGRVEALLEEIERERSPREEPDESG